MIDLDAVWTDKDELYCQFGAALCSSKITYDQWRGVTNWIGIMKYIYPAQRIYCLPLIDILYARLRKQVDSPMLGSVIDIAWLTALSMIACHMIAHYTEQDQIRIAAILEEPNDSRMEKRPDFRGIIETQEYEYDYGNPTS